MSPAIKALLIVWLFGAAIGLAVVCQTDSEEPIAVSVSTSTQGAKHEQKVVLKAALNGNGLSHGEVRLDFTSTNSKDLVSISGSGHSIQGYTDGQGLFITTEPAFPPGEYMITALVSKAGCADGKSVCFLRVPESRQDRRLIKAPISISSSNRPGG